MQRTSENPIYFYLTPRELHAHARRGDFARFQDTVGTETLPKDIIILLSARARARINTGSKTNDDGVATAAEGKQLRGGICHAYSNRRQIKSASVRRVRCCGEYGGISQFPSSPSIVPCILVESRAGPSPLSLSHDTGCISERCRLANF